MANNVTLINGDAHSWSQISLTLLGRVVEGVTAINYDLVKNKTNNKGRGNKPVSRGQGQKEFTANITLSEAEIQAIENALPPGKDITDIKHFPIIVSFEDDGILKTHKLIACEFLNRGLEVDTENTDIQKTLDLIVGDIDWKVV